MKTPSAGNHLARTIMVMAVLFAALPQISHASGPGLPAGGGYTFTNTPLDQWSFRDNTNWTSDLGYAPVSFTNLNSSTIGNGSTLVLDTNIPAWLQYNVHEGDGTTNLTVDKGTVAFWFAPNWSSTNDVDGGLGPQVWGRLFEVGGYTSDSSYGLWSIYVDPAGANIYFSAQTNDSSGNIYTLSAPIDWTTNYFHFVALSYSATNTALYLDGVLATNGAPVTNYPGPDVLANGFYVGSDSNGVFQAHGLFNTLRTYNAPLNADAIKYIFDWDYGRYMMSPWNSAMFHLSSASSASSPVAYQAITGIGSLQWVGAASSCANGTNSNTIWITNVMATAAGNGTMNLTFTIEGGASGIAYDVFANSVLGFGTNSVPWAWMGQGLQCTTYMLTNLPNTTCFLILGSPQDTDLDGLTDAYEKLVSHTNPNVADTDGDGIPDGWEVLLGLNPNVSDNAQSSSRLNYSYDMADWLEGISGAKTGSVSLDNEGNVLSVSQ